MKVLREKMFVPLKFSNFQYLRPLTVSKKFISYFGKWEKPQGHDAGIMVYNSATNQKVPLILKRENLASWYICGPTVYAESHIGHASCYVKFDVIRRILKLFNINALLLLGITDIDDKIIKKSNEAGISASQLAKTYELDFLQDMETMRVLPPTAISRVSQNIPLIISFCEKLIEKEFAYVTKEGNVYFMVSKGVTADVQNESPREIVHEDQIDPSKKDPRDFALWKATKPNEPFWSSPWGNGRPGWHIECSAIVSKMFGSNLDLHSGGMDLLYPHHSNEVSQSQAYHSCSQWVNYWLHAGLLQVDDELKMSKSLGNTISVKDFLKEHFVNDFRLLCLQSSYRKNLFFSSETLSGAKSLHKKIHNFINECELYINGELRGPVDEDILLSQLASTKELIISYLKNDFNTSQALFCLTDFIDEVNKNLPTTNASAFEVPNSISVIAECYFYVNDILETLGITILSKKRLPKDVLFAVDSTVEFRNKIRLLALNPKIGDCEKITHLVDNAYETLEKELDLISKSEVNQQFIADLLNDSKTYYKAVYQCAEILDLEETLLGDIKPKKAREIMSPIFKKCDEFRSTLQQKSIGIKDRGNSSSWIPLIDLQRNIV